MNEARTLTGRELPARSGPFAIVRERRARFSRNDAVVAGAIQGGRSCKEMPCEADTATGPGDFETAGPPAQKLTQADRLLAALSDKAVLARGFALVKDADGMVIKRAAEVVSGMALSLEFADGTADAVATSGTPQPKAVAKPAAKAKAPGNQGSLFCGRYDRIRPAF
jgi:exodeoxyribonuclease VII large subunit